jgi:REP element-mobilizing transposase RayT
MTYYERNLPHWHPEGAAVFLTWRLHGTCAQFRSDEPDAGKAFAAFDRALHQAAGPKWLAEPAVAQCVIDALRFGERQLKLYRLIAFSVMPNHVHVVLEPIAPLAKITKSIKGYTAREANRLLGRTGEPFWNDESYDHWVRERDELSKVVRYTERNPVAAGLVETVEGWRWSSAYQE